jgi:hypothetical protein
MSLKKVKKYLVEGGFDMLKDFSKEGGISKDVFIGHSLHLVETIHDVMHLDSWDELIKMVYNGELGVLGYGNLDDLMEDVAKWGSI